MMTDNCLVMYTTQRNVRDEKYFTVTSAKCQVEVKPKRGTEAVIL